MLHAANIFEHTDDELASLRLKAECLGGGRINRNNAAKEILVYGYSVVSLILPALLDRLHLVQFRAAPQGFGCAKHEVAVELLQREFPAMSCTCKYEGY